MTSTSNGPASVTTGRRLARSAMLTVAVFALALVFGIGLVAAVAGAFSDDVAPVEAIAIGTVDADRSVTTGLIAEGDRSAPLPPPVGPHGPVPDQEPVVVTLTVPSPSTGDSSIDTGVAATPTTVQRPAASTTGRAPASATEPAARPVAASDSDDQPSEGPSAVDPDAGAPSDAADDDEPDDRDDVGVTHDDESDEPDEADEPDETDEPDEPEESDDEEPSDDD